MTTRARGVAVALLMVALSAAAPRGAAKRPIAETDLYKFTWIADPQISRFAESVAFVQVTVNEKDNKYESSIYTVRVSGEGRPQRLTAGTRDTTPRWSPDGEWLAFLRPDDKEVPQVHLMSMRGGEPRALTALPKAAGAPVWAPDGKSIAFMSTMLPDDMKKSDPAAKAERKSDVKVVTRAVYRSNGNPTYVDPDRHTHIWTVAVNGTEEKAAPRPITSGDFDERGVQWSPDGATLYFVSDRVPESYYNAGDSDIYRVPAAGGEITKVTSIDGSIGSVSVSPDGKRLAFVGALSGEPIRSYSQPDLWVVDATPGSTPKNLTASYDFDISGGIGGDQSAPRGEQPKPIIWLSSPAHGDSLIVTAAENGSSNLKWVSIATGKVTPLTEGAHDIGAYTISRNGAIAAIVSTQTSSEERP